MGYLKSRELLTEEQRQELKQIPSDLNAREMAAYYSIILDYISNEALRRKIQKGLNKGEATNALARAIFFGKRGELHEKALKDQLQRASALNIIINAISVWNTVYLEKAIDYLKERNVLKEELLNYISPLDWEHINFLGEYTFNIKNITSLNNLRSLNEPNNLNFP